jgi:4-amino-4-deoxy-L-arabinose transferase-like glycosyltransferase
MGGPVTVLRARVGAMSPSTRRFWYWVIGLAALGLTIRALYIYQFHNDWRFWGDSWLYKYEARLIADGQWFKDPADYFLRHHTISESADHPPVFILFLAAMEFVGITALHTQMLLCAMVGTGTIVVLALLGRRLGGERVGILAALAGAIYPNLWINDGMLMSETMFVFFIALALLCAYRYWDAPSLKRALILSVTMTLAVMTRSEGLLLLPLVVAPVIAFTKGWDWGRRLRTLAAAALASFLMIAPWVGYNFSRFENHVYLAAGDGYVLGVGNCELTYSGPFLGYWTPGCILGPGRKDPPKGSDMSQKSAFYREQAFDFISNHKRQVPKVVAARIGRLWELYRPGQNARLDIDVEGRGEVPVWLGLIGYYALVPFAIAGAVILRRRRVKIWPFLVVVVMIATVTAAISFGITRYRSAAEIALVVFGAVGFDALLSWFARRRRTRGSSGAPEPPPGDRTEAAPELEDAASNR